MFNFIKNFFQYKAKSIEEFAEVVKREGCRTVLVDPQRDFKNNAYSITVGLIADFQYILKFTATTPRGRKIVYRENLFERFGSDRGFADTEERRNAAIRLFLFGEQKVDELRTKLPGISVDLIGPEGQIMDNTMYTKLHHDAKVCGVSI